MDRLFYGQERLEAVPVSRLQRNAAIGSEAGIHCLFTRSEEAAPGYPGSLQQLSSAFLPFLPMHLLVQNLLYDISQVGIPFDNVD
jgi:hypothetical protein